MDKEVIKNLKSLKTIEPDRDFKDSTLRIVLASKNPSRTFSLPRWSLVFGAAVVFIAFLGITAGIFKNNNNVASPLLLSLNSDQLVNEYKNIGSDFYVKEISYEQDVNKTIAIALNEIAKTKGNHLNPNILMEESQFINNINSGENSDINIMLDKVIF